IRPHERASTLSRRDDYGTTEHPQYIAERVGTRERFEDRAGWHIFRALRGVVNCDTWREAPRVTTPLTIGRDRWASPGKAPMSASEGPTLLLGLPGAAPEPQKFKTVR